MPAPTGVSQQAQLGVAAAGSTTATFPANPPASHVLAVAFFHDTMTVPTVTGIGTWVRYAAIGQVGGNMSFFICVNPSGSAKVLTVTCGGATRIVGIAVDMTGVDQANPFDRAAYAQGQNPTANAQGVIPLYPNAGVLAFGWYNDILGDISGGTAGGFTALTAKQQAGGAGGTITVVGSYRLSAPPSGTSLGLLQVATVAGQATNIAVPTRQVGNGASAYPVPNGIANGDVIVIGLGSSHPEVVIATLGAYGVGVAPVISVSPALQYAHDVTETVGIAQSYGTSWASAAGSLRFGGMAVSLRGAPLAALNLAMTMAGTSGMAVGTPVWGAPATDILEFALLDGTTLAQLAILSNATQGSWLDAFNDTGSGTFMLAVADAKAALLRSGRVVSCRLNGLERFRYWLDAPQKAAAAPEGQAGEFWTCAGRGWEAYLERGVFYPSDGFGTARTTSVPLTGYAGAILAQILRTMQARGALAPVAWDFSETYDSSGNPWTTPLSLTVNVGTDLLSIVRQLRGLGVAVRLRRDFVLQAWDLASAGRHLETSVVLREGYHFSGPVPYNQPTAQLRTRMVVEGEAGTIAEVTHPTLTAPLELAYGRREGYLRVTGATDVPTLTTAGRAAIADSQSATESITVPLIHGSGYDGYASFEPGDWIAIDAQGTWDRVAYRLAGLTFAQADAGGYQSSVVLASLPHDAFLALQAKVDALG